MIKVPILGFDEHKATAPSTFRGYGILQLCQPLPPSPNEFYRSDIGNEHGLIRYLSKNRSQIVDPYPGPVEALH
jgi:hypothetical protein